MKNMLLISTFLLASTICYAKEIQVNPGDNLRLKFKELVGGDTMKITPGKYQIGYDDTQYPECRREYTYDCVIAPIPSGPDPDHPTRIIGDATNPPQLWGTERAAYILNLRGSSNVIIENLELTDHSPCTWYGGGAPTKCKRDAYPYGAYADYGIVAQDSKNVLLNNVNIHGFHIGGIQAFRLTNWKIQDSKINMNSFVGWDGDAGKDANGNPLDSANHGTIQFINTQIQFNGCGETVDGKPYNCMSQTTGGYGDGLGVGLNKEAIWFFFGVDVSHNTSDGIDLLYNNGDGQAIIQNSHLEGNAGNQLKTAMATNVINSGIIGNCDYFITDNPNIAFNVDHCRAAGNTVVFDFPKAGLKSKISASKITGNGDVLILTSSLKNAQCDGTESVTYGTTELVPGTEFHSGEPTKIYYDSGVGGNADGTCANIPLTQDDESTPVPLPTPTPTPTPAPIPDVIKLGTCECQCKPGG